MIQKIEINLPKELMIEIESFIKNEGMTVNEFLFCAIGEKIGEIRMGRGLKNLKQISLPEQNKNTSDPNQPKIYKQNQLLRASEVAKVLEISKQAAYKLIQTRELPAVRFGRSVRVKFEDVEKFIENNHD